MNPKTREKLIRKAKLKLKGDRGSVIDLGQLEQMGAGRLGAFRADWRAEDKRCECEISYGHKLGGNSVSSKRLKAIRSEAKVEIRRRKAIVPDRGQSGRNVANGTGSAAIATDRARSVTRKLGHGIMSSKYPQSGTHCMACTDRSAKCM